MPILRFPNRVQKAAEAWYRYTKNVRDTRKQMLTHYANGWFGDSGTKRSPQPLNLIDRGVQIIAPFLVAHNPRVSITPRAGLNNSGMRPFANTMELALAHLFDEIELADYTLRPIVIDALFCMGISKTDVMHSHQVEIMGYLHDLGQPYCDRIDFDDYIGDVSARNRQEMRLEGHKYRLDEEYVKTCGLFKNYDKLKPDLDLFGDTKAETVGKPSVNAWEYQELRPTVELMDIWLPEENVVITLPGENGGDRIMRTVEWDGPEGGPFDILAFRYFPNSIIPIPPVYTWLDLNKSLNSLVIKMQSQSERGKSIGLYNANVADEAERIKDARDGEMIGVSSTDAFKEMTFGGFDSQAFPFVQYLEAQYSVQGGNLYTIGGRSSQAQTLGQEQMLMSNASRMLDDMVSQTYSFTKNICKKLAWFLWSDPLIIIPVIKRIAGIDIQTEYSKAVQEGDFFDFSFDIEPYSLSKLNPEMRYQRLMQLISQIVLPTAQIAAAQGSVLKVDNLIKEMARYLGINNTDDWWQTALPVDISMNPYQPLKGEVGSGQTDGRFSGGDEASNFNNAIQQQSRAGGQTTAEM